MTITKIFKRDGRIVDFDKDRITNAIYRAFMASGVAGIEEAQKLSNKVVKELNKRFTEEVPSVEDVQDIVIEQLSIGGYEEVAKSYHSYREKKAETRKIKEELEIGGEPKLTVNSLEVLKKRYLLKNDEGDIIETPSEMFRRVARAIADPDKKFDGDPKKTEEEFYSVMSRLEFLPNSPTLFNAGTGTDFALSACYVLPVEDSLIGIFDSVKNTALIEQTGGGVGFNFSRLRPKGDIVRSTKGVASGPVSFMRVFDVTTDVIKSGGRRRGAMMAILRVDHPDILEFIRIKAETGTLSNFNVSVAITDSFMDALNQGTDYDLINPRNGEIINSVSARRIWDEITESAWRSGDPGVVFIDEINRHNPTPNVGKIEATNPCGEQPLLPYESCNLGSINLSKMVEKRKINWDKLRDTIKIAVHFLDKVIEVNPWPIPEIGEITGANRKIGLGVMGFAELLIQLGVPYDSDEALKIGEQIAKFLEVEAVKVDEDLAEKRGTFKNLGKSIWKEGKARRNATVTTIAPTGTISIIAGSSSGIEPIFAIAFMRNVLEGERLLELNPLFERTAKDQGFYNSDLLEEIARVGSTKGVEGVPEDVKRLFVTAHDISPEWHVKMQAVFQRHTENAVSKTVNLPENATVKDVSDVYHLAHELGCKGVTVYRYGSKEGQVLNLGLKEEKDEYVMADENFAGGKPLITCEICG
jgi:ribonucleoside-diphosphate reductase alpha chain